MSAPVLDTVAADLYQRLQPLAYADDANGYALAYLSDALGAMFQPLSDLVRDTPDGPGWSPIVDVDRAPIYALGYLAQFVGVRLLQGLSDSDQRSRVRSTDGMRRGSIAAFAAAALPHLTGGRHVIVRERFKPTDPLVDHAYHVQVITFTSETPDSAVVLAALLTQKPGGLVLHYDVEDGQDFEQVRETYATFDDVRTTYTTLDDLRTDTP